MLTLSDIQVARTRLSPHLAPTPLEAAPGLGAAVWLKLENANLTHSFKIRGALNALLALDPAVRARGILAASSGNHAQGVACAAQMLGAQARILMPHGTPQRKVDGVRRYGAQAVLFGATYDEAEAEARRVAQAEGLYYLSPYNDPFVIAGGGTIGLELLEQLPGLARVVVCGGGGGLISGIATALKALRPQVEVVAACAEHAPALYNALTGSHLPQRYPTLAEALSGDIEAGSLTIALTRQLVDHAVLVSETAIAQAIGWMLDTQGWLTEGGGVVGVAALRSGVLAAKPQPTAVVVSGANIDGSTLRAVLGIH